MKYQYWYEASEEEAMDVREVRLYRNQLDSDGKALQTEMFDLGRTPRAWIKQSWTYLIEDGMQYDLPQFVDSMEDLLTNILNGADEEYEELQDTLKSDYEYYRSVIKELI